MPDDGRVVIQLTNNAKEAAADFGKFNKEVDDAEKALKGLALQGKKNTKEFKDLQGKLNRAKKQMGGVEKSTLNLSSALKGLGLAVIAVKIKDIGQQSLIASSKFEQLAISFEILAGGKKAGDELTNSLINLANTTPLTTEGLAQNAKLLLSFGEATNEVINDLRILGDIAGGDKQRLNSLALAFAQVGAAGRLTGQDLLQMINAGFNPLQIISEKTGKSIGELRDEMSAGMISFDMVKDAMVAATSEGGRFFNLMNRQSETLGGRFSTLQDKTELLGKTIGDILAPAAKAAIEGMILLVESSDKLIKNFRIANAEIQNLQLTELQQKLRQVWVEQEKVNAQIGRGLGRSAAFGSQRLNVLKEEERRIKERLNLLGKQQRQENELNATRKKSGFSKPQQQEQIGAFEQLTTKAKELKETLQNLQAQGVVDINEFNRIRNEYDLTAEKIKDINSIFKETEMLSVAVSASLSDSLKEALTTPFAEGETAADRFGQVLLGIYQTLLEKTVELFIIKPLMEKLFSSFKQGGNSAKDLAKSFSTMAASAPVAAIGVSQLSTTVAASSGQMASGVPTSAALAETYKKLASSSTEAAAATAMQAISQAALTTAMIPFVGGFLAPIAAAATGAAIGAGAAVAGAGIALGTGLTRIAGARADGGAVSAGSTYLVGERGAELFVPNTSGQIVSNEDLKAGGSPTVNIYNQAGASVETLQRPNGDMDIFIKKVNMALENERTNSAFGEALNRQQSTGVQAA